MSDEGLPGPADFPVLMPQRTRWADNDVYGHVNNAYYYQYFDDAVNSWLMQATGVDIRELPVFGVVAETSCRYLSEISFPDELRVGVALDRRGRTSVIYRLAVFVVGENGEPREVPAAVGRFVHVYIGRETRRPEPIPEVVAKALATLESLAS